MTVRKTAFFVLLSLVTAGAGLAQTPSAPQTQPAAKQEVLKIDWPAEYNWKVGSDQDDGKMRMVEVVPGNETVDNWSIIGSLLVIKGAVGVPMDAVLDGARAQIMKLDSVAKLTVLERTDTGAHPSILYKIESPTLHDGGKPESQVFYFVQGSTSLFNAIVGVKEASLSDDFVNKWKGVFHTSRLSLE